MTDKYMILHGDSLQELKKLGDSSIDSVVTDPPYGLSKEPKIDEVLSKWLAGEEYDHGHGGFMGKSWDSFVPHPDLWREVYRVLKPGGHALIFAGTRTQDLMTISLRLAGFEVRDVIEWLYFSGFPKSHDVGKAFDKRKGGASFVHVFSKVIKEKRLQKGLSLSYMDSEVCGGSTNYYWFEGRPAGVRLPQLAEYFKIKEILELDDTYDDLMEAAEREKVGEKTSGIGQAFGDGVWVSESKVVDITAPATDLAKQWDGWGTALKPAHEPIIVVRKPLEGTVADTVEEYGTGAINIDGSRIAEEGYAEKAIAKYTGTISQQSVGRGFMTSNGGSIECQRPEALEKGRFPANCITLDSDEFYSKYFNVASAQEAQPNVTPAELSKKASKKNRNSDWQGEEIALEERAMFGEKEGRSSFAMNSPGSKSFTKNRNTHPTVKPTDLMAWLVRLVTPPEGIVLDPFAGSGSTLVAAKREGFGFVGVELTDEYIPIIEARTGETVSEIEAEEEEEDPKEEALV